MADVLPVYALASYTVYRGSCLDCLICNVTVLHVVQTALLGVVQSLMLKEKLNN